MNNENNEMNIVPNENNNNENNVIEETPVRNEEIQPVNTLNVDNFNNQGNYVPPVEPVKQGGSNKGLLIVIVILLLIAIGVGSYFLFFKDKDNDKPVNGGNNNGNNVDSNVQILYCTGSVEGQVEIEAELKFKNNKFEIGKFTETMDLSDYNDQQISLMGEMDVCAEILKQSNEQFTFSNCKQSIVGKKLVINTDYNLNPEMGNTEVDLEEGKALFAEQGLTCTIR